MSRALQPAAPSVRALLPPSLSLHQVVEESLPLLFYLLEGSKGLLEASARYLRIRTLNALGDEALEIALQLPGIVEQQEPKQSPALVIDQAQLSLLWSSRTPLDDEFFQRRGFFALVELGRPRRLGLRFFV